MVPHGRLPLAVLTVSAVLGLATGVTAVVVGTGGHATVATAGPAAPGEKDEPAGLGVLRAWDARRSRAYARADLAGLADLYLPGSRTGAADIAVLRDYRDRGLRVTRMRTQVLAASVLHESRRRITLLVTDVLLDATAVDVDARAWRLPRDRPSTRRVVLVRHGGTWRVAEAYDAD